MRPVRAVVVPLMAGILAGALPLLAQEQPLVAGADGVPVPKKTKAVKPVYPPEALAQGLRGIVILDLLIDDKGRVASTTVIRSVPGLDAAAVAAARQWEYEPTRVDGRPVSVRLTVPVTFTLALPALARDPGIPELRQGVVPLLPQGSPAGTAAAEVTLDGDGLIGAARVVEGDEPWAGALLSALRTWRFSMPPEGVSLSFRVEARFAPGRGGEPARVGLKATGLQRAGADDQGVLVAQGGAAASPEPPTPASPAKDAPQTAPPPQDAPAPPPPGAPQAPGSVPDALAPPSTAPGAPAPPGTVPLPPTTAPAPAPRAADPTAPPPVEVITAPPPPQPAENGVSAVRDVTLEPGVPDLTRGRRPVAPPLARMSGATGTVEVAFSVGAAGSTMVQNVSGPELLRKAAEQAVASWVFRRTRADRAYLTAVFDYGPDKTSVVVRPQPATGASQPAPEATAAPGPEGTPEPARP